MAMELFVFPARWLWFGGRALMLIALIMAMVDLYPAPNPRIPGMPVAELSQLRIPLQNLALAMIGSLASILCWRDFCPKRGFIAPSFLTQWCGLTAKLEQQQASRVGQIGTTVSVLRPGGKARFGEDILMMSEER